MESIMELFSLDSIAIALILSTIGWVLYGLASVVYTFAVGPKIHQVDFKSKGKWALVTGCTDGIGKQYARELAARGCDIILVSRSMDKLKATAEEIEKDYKVETKIIQADFCGGDEIYSNIEKEISGLEVGTLVNNVGMSYPYPEYFLDVPDWATMIPNLIKANIVSLTQMSKIVLPAMVQRGKGVVINIGSASSVIPSPLLTVYAASKAYVEKFSEGLQIEYGKRGIITQVVLPGFVCSNMSGIKKSSFFAPTAKEFVKSAISLVGTTSNTIGYLPHVIFINAVNSICAVSSTFGHWMVTRSMETSRRRAIKKYKKH